MIQTFLCNLNSSCNLRENDSFNLFCGILVIERFQTTFCLNVNNFRACFIVNFNMFCCINDFFYIFQIKIIRKISIVTILTNEPIQSTGIFIKFHIQIIRFIDFLKNITCNQIGNIISAEFSVTSCINLVIFNVILLLRCLHDRNIKCSTTEVIHQHCSNWLDFL